MKNEECWDVMWWNYYQWAICIVSKYYISICKNTRMVTLIVIHFEFSIFFNICRLKVNMPLLENYDFWYTTLFDQRSDIPCILCISVTVLIGVRPALWLHEWKVMTTRWSHPVWKCLRSLDDCGTVWRRIWTLAGRVCCLFIVIMNSVDELW